MGCVGFVVSFVWWVWVRVVGCCFVSRVLLFFSAMDHAWSLRNEPGWSVGMVFGDETDLVQV